jgi:REP element-mobilizing transposase RayT
MVRIGGFPMFTPRAVGCLSLVTSTAACRTAVIHHLIKPPPEKPLFGLTVIWMYCESWAKKGVALGHYDLKAFVVMANHIHILLLPRIAPGHLLRSFKGASAREANRVLHRTGEPFWQAESCDHWVRDSEEQGRIVAYIENNPVKSGLVAKAGDYRWSSAGMSPGTSMGCGAAVGKFE